MLEELRNASSLLQVALDHYVHICSKVQNACLQEGTIPQNDTPDYVEHVERELGLVESYDTKMQLAKTAIRAVHNYAFHIAPINRLPPELLTRIVHAARDADAYSVDRVALVCSRWRTIVLEDSSLWNRIDIHPSFRDSYPSLIRAEAHVLRSGGTPLDIHVWGAPDPLWNTKEEFDETPMESLCRLVSSRMKCLAVSGDFGSRQWLSSTCSAITILLSECTLGVLTEITTSSDFGGFFTSGWGEGETEAEDASFSSQAVMQLEMADSELEAALACVTILNFHGLYLPWTSQAYHGLTELRLTGHSSGNPSIPERQLMDILKSSPGLRIIQFGLRITDLVGGENLSVSLPELEVLQVEAEEVGHMCCYLGLVRFLKPGLRPLRFTMRCYGNNLAGSSEANTKAFLARSNVTQFYAYQVRHPFDLLTSMSHLTTLILFYCVPFPTIYQSLFGASRQRKSAPAVYPKLDICFVLNCSISLDEFRPRMQQCQAQSIVIYCSEFHRGIDGPKVDTATVIRELSEICPDVKVTNVIPEYLCFSSYR